MAKTVAQQQGWHSSKRGNAMLFSWSLLTKRTWVTSNFATEAKTNSVAKYIDEV